METPMDDPIVCYSAFYPPAHWEYIQEQLCEDTSSDFWAGMTLEYHAMLEKAAQSFSEHLAFDSQTTKTSEDFCLDPTNCGPDTKEMWRTLKKRAVERSGNLHSIAEEEEPEETADVKETSQEVSGASAPLREQPAVETAVAISDSSAPGTKEPIDLQPIGTGLPWGNIFPEYSPGYATSTSTSSTSKCITWAPLPDTTKTPRKPPRSRRFRQSLGFLRGLVCCWS